MCKAIRDEMEENSLACSNGAYDASLGLASLGYVFASKVPQKCTYYHFKSGKAICYYDSKGAISNAYCWPQPGVMAALDTDYDLLKLVHNLLQAMPVTILGTWVKGHYITDSKEIKYTLNQRADTLVTGFQRSQPSRFATLRRPMPSPSYAVQFFYDNSVLTSKYYSAIAAVFHNSTLKTYIQRKTKWDDDTFYAVDWGAHRQAFTRLTRAQHVTVAILIHNLANTNCRNFLFYGTSKLC
jgi:hypothetical protein